MNNKIKYSSGRNTEPVEFDSNYVYIELPNGTRLRLHYDNKEEALIVQKEGSVGGDTRITVNPGVSNVILLK